MTSKPLNHIQLKSADLLLAVADNCRRIRERFKRSETKIILSFLDVKDNPLHETQMISNQIIVIYRSGRFEVLPQGINGYCMKDYLGVRYSRIKYWCVLPALGSKHNPAGSSSISGIMHSENRDVYEC